MKDYIAKRFPALGQRDFRLFWSSYFVSNVGSQMQFVALNWHVYLLTHSALALGFVGFLRFFSLLLFSLIGGSVADAHNRKKVLFITQSAMVMLSLVLAITAFNHTISVNLIFLITALFFVLLAFDIPARQSFIPTLVDRKNIPSAMNLNSIGYELAIIIGPTIAGFLIARTSLGLIYGLNTVSYLVILAGLFFIHSTGAVEGIVSPISWSAIKEGLAFVSSRTLIWSTMLLDFLSTFFSSAMALMPIFAKDILSAGPQELGLLYAAPSIGAVGAGLLLAHKHNLRHQGLILLSGVMIYATGTVMFGFSHVFITSFLALIIVGSGDCLSTIIRNTIRQLETPDYIRGRMISINMIFFMGGPQLGDFEAGVVANYMSAPFAVITGGIATLVIAGLTLVGVPKLRKYDKYRKKVSQS